MAISVGNIANGGVIAAQTSETFSLNNNKEDVIVLVALRDERTAATVTATYAGAAMTADVSQSQQDNSSTKDLRTYIFRKQGAATGANDVVVTFSNSVEHGGAFAVAVSDLNDTGQPDAIASAGENEPGSEVTIDTSITTVAADTIIFDVVYGKDNADYTVGTGRTQIGQLSPNGGDDRCFASYVIKSAAGSYTIDWADTNYGDDYSHSVVSYKATVASSSIKTVNGLARASVKTVNGLAIASVKTVNGLA